jgi:hypothetical protein
MRVVFERLRVAGFCEPLNESFGFINHGFLDEISKCQNLYQKTYTIMLVNIGIFRNFEEEKVMDLEH